MTRKSWHFYYYREERSMRVKHYNGNKKNKKKKLFKYLFLYLFL